MLFFTLFCREVVKTRRGTEKNGNHDEDVIFFNYLSRKESARGYWLAIITEVVCETDFPGGLSSP